MSKVEDPATVGEHPSEPTRAWLATVTPGNDLLCAFGHTAIVFEHGNASASVSGAAPIAYSYGGYTLPPIRLNLKRPDRAGVMEAISSAALEWIVPIVRGTTRAHKMRQSLSDLRRAIGPEQTLHLDELHLTQHQLNALHARITLDFARVEPGLGSAGGYFYHHFRSNCATRLRDEIFGALGPEHIAELRQRENANASLEQIIEQSLAMALEAHTAGIRMFPEHLRAHVTAFLPGAPLVSTNPKDFLSILRVALMRLSTMGAFATGIGETVLAEASRVLDEEIKRPRPFVETLFTPQRLRDALGNWPNPVLEANVLSLIQ